MLVNAGNLLLIDGNRAIHTNDIKFVTIYKQPYSINLEVDDK